MTRLLGIRETDLSREHSRERGITVLEVLIIIVVVCVVVAVGAPILHSRSRAAVLDANMRSLASMVQEEALAGYRWDYSSDGSDTADIYLSSHLVTLLREAVGRTVYVNPYASSRTSSTILNSAQITADADVVPPAVFLTNSPDCRYDAFNALPFETARRHLTGTIMVDFDAEGRNVDVFYVDAGGNKSPRVIRVPMA